MCRHVLYTYHSYYLDCCAAELTRDDRKKLYCNFGLLYRHGHSYRLCSLHHVELLRCRADA
jgi:hypothetical protein